MTAENIMKNCGNDIGQLLQQMEKYKFDEPYKVTVVIEETEEINTQNDSSSKTCFISREAPVRTPLSNYLNTSNTCTIESTINDKEEHNLLNGTNHYHIPNLKEIEVSIPYNNSNYSAEHINLLNALEILSENIILLIRHGFRTNYYQCDQYLYEKAKQDYMAVKLKIFEASLPIISTVMIPQENNGNFFERFVNGTIRIARGKSLNYITKDIVEYLTADLVKLAKIEIKSRIESRHELNQNIMTVENQQTYECHKLPKDNTHNRICRESNELFRSNDSTEKLRKQSSHETLKRILNNTNSDNASTIPTKRLKRNETHQPHSTWNYNVDPNNELYSSSQRMNMNTAMFHPAQVTDYRRNNYTDVHSPVLLRPVSRDSGIESPTGGCLQPTNYMETMYENAIIRNNEGNNYMNPMLLDYLPFEKYCSVCQKPSIITCSGCGEHNYCSGECQIKHSIVHKHICGK